MEKFTVVADSLTRPPGNAQQKFVTDRKENILKVILVKCANSLKVFFQLFLYAGFEQYSLQLVINLIAWLIEALLHTIDYQINSFQVAQLA